MHNKIENIYYMLKRKLKVYYKINFSLFIFFVFLDTNEIRKSNVITVSPPLEMPVKTPITDRYFPYISINSEATPSDTRLESKFIVLCNIEKCLNGFIIIKLCCFGFFI